MQVFIKKSFSNLKLALFVSFAGISVIVFYIFHVSTYIEQIANIKEQQILIDKVLHTDLHDPKMASILINDSLSKMALLNKRLSEAHKYDILEKGGDEEKQILKNINQINITFNNNVLDWSESLDMTRQSTYKKVVESHKIYLNTIAQLQTIATNNILDLFTDIRNISYGLLMINFFIWILYRHRLSQVSSDLDNVCSTDMKVSTFNTEEINFLSKRLLRKTPVATTNSVHIHQATDLYNEKGVLSVFNAKKVSRSANNVFLTLFQIDQYSHFIKLPIENRYTIIKKIGEIISMYEQSLDIIGYLENNDRIVFISSRLNRQLALDDAEKIRATVQETSFNTNAGPMKFTISGGILLKVPAKSIDEIIEDAAILIEKAQQSGGNQIGRIR